MTDTSNPKRAGKREFKAKAILTSGIPLEMAVYDFLASGLGADWIEPEYEFAALNETGGVIQRSLDFVASVPTSRNPLDERSVQLYLLTECKYCNPNELIWLFMPDVAPKVANIFDDWRPALWQESEPRESVQTGEVPRCVRGTILGLAESDGQDETHGKNQRKIPILATTLHQLRDCLHCLAIERFRLFTKHWSQPRAIVFVPIVVTNAELRVLKPGTLQELLNAGGDSQLPLDQITTVTKRLLVRCPSSLGQVDWKWQRFHTAHGNYDLSRIEKGLPAYKRERTIEFHLRNFFTSTPSHIMVVNFEEMPQVLTEVVAWVKGMEFM